MNQHIRLSGAFRLPESEAVPVPPWRGREYENLSSEEIARFARGADLRASTSLYPAEHRDPIITPIITAALSTIGITGTAASIVSAIAVTAITIGIQALFMQAPKPPKPQDGKAPKVQSVPYRLWGVGETRIAGAYMLWDEADDRLVAVVALCGHRIHAITQLYLHDDKVTRKVSGYLENGDDSRYGGNNVWMDYRLGLPTETVYPLVVSTIGDADIWGSAHRGDGQASLALVCSSVPQEDFQKVYPSGIPAPSAVAQLARVWDFRNPAQDPEDPSTWGFSKNAVLCLAWHECFSEFGSGRDYTKALLPVIDVWKAEADICDENVPKAVGGTEKRYEVSGWDTAENDPKAATNAILASCDGWLCERGDGALLITVGKFREELVTTLTDADIVGHRIDYGVLLDEEINRITPRFTYPETDYSDAVTDYFEDVPAQLEAGRVMASEAEYRWVTQWRQARRLGKREWLRIQEKRRGTLDVRLSGINSVYSRWVKLETPKRIPSMDGAIVENRRSVLALLQGGFQMEFIEHPDDIDVWVPATDEGAVPPVPDRTSADELPTPVIDSLTAVSNGTSVFLRAAIVEPTREGLTPMLRYRLADAGSGSPGPWVEQAFPNITPASGLLVVNTNPVPGDTALNAQAAFRATGGSVGDWSTPALNITTTLDSTPPAAPVAFQAPLNVSTVELSARAANTPANTRAIVFKRGTTGQAFAAATLLMRLNATPNLVVELDDTPGAGTYRYWAGSENGSGIANTTPVYLDVTVP